MKNKLLLGCKLFILSITLTTSILSRNKTELHLKDLYSSDNFFPEYKKLKKNYSQKNHINLIENPYKKLIIKDRHTSTNIEKRTKEEKISIKLLNTYNKMKNPEDKEEIKKLLTATTNINYSKQRNPYDQSFKKCFLSSIGNITSKTGIICATITISLAQIKGIITAEEMVHILGNVKEICVVLKDSIKWQTISHCLKGIFGVVPELLKKFL